MPIAAPSGKESTERRLTTAFSGATHLYSLSSPRRWINVRVVALERSGKYNRIVKQSAKCRIYEVRSQNSARLQQAWDHTAWQGSLNFYACRSSLRNILRQIWCIR